MKGLISFLFFILMTSVCQAQESKGIEVPFLPYVQMTGTGAVGNINTAIPFDNTSRSKKRVSTVFFDSENSTAIRKEDLGVIKSVAGRITPKNGSVRLVGYRTSKMSPTLVNDRLEAVAGALRDLGVTRILFSTEVRNNNVISVHRVDIFEL